MRYDGNEELDRLSFMKDKNFVLLICVCVCACSCVHMSVSQALAMWTQADLEFSI